MPTMTRAEARKQIEERLEEFPRGRVPREIRRAQLLHLGAEMFAERGYAATSMDELAAAAGVSKPVIYSIFGSKEGLFLEMVEQIGTELSEVILEAISEKASPSELLQSGSLAFFTFVAERKDEWQVAFGTLGTVTSGDDAVARKVLEIRERQDGLVRAVLEAKASELGIEVDEVELEGMARAINGAFEGLVSWWPDHQDVTPEQLTELLTNLILPGLEGLAASAGD